MSTASSTYPLRATIVTRLLAGEAPADIAADLGLDTEDDGDDLAVILPGWACADESGTDCYYPEEATAREAAQEYCDSGDWESADHTWWSNVSTWRVGLVVDDTFDERRVVEVRLDEGSEKIAMDPEEPACARGCDHSWSDDSRLGAGGPYGHGGGVRHHDVCTICGLGRTSDSWAQDPTDGTQGHAGIEYDREDTGLADYLESLGADDLESVEEFGAARLGRDPVGIRWGVDAGGRMEWFIDEDEARGAAAAAQAEAEDDALRALVDRYQHPSHSAGELVDLARAGATLWRLDSGNAGEDDILVGEEAEVLAGVCAHREVDALPGGWSLDRIWPEG